MKQGNLTFIPMQLSLMDKLNKQDNQQSKQLSRLQKEMKSISQIELSYKVGKALIEFPKITCSQDCVDALRESWDAGKIEFVEQFKVVLLNRANRILGIYELSTGGVSGTVADPKLVFSAALLACASGIILSHNHPSGSLSPSAADIQATKKMKEAGKLLDIEVLDHVILTAEGYYSFADNGEI